MYALLFHVNALFSSAGTGQVRGWEAYLHSSETTDGAVVFGEAESKRGEGAERRRVDDTEASAQDPHQSAADEESSHATHPLCAKGLPQ